MTEIEPTIENVREGDIVTLETGTPGEPGHGSNTYRAMSGWHGIGGERSLDTLRTLTRVGYRITRIDRPAPPIPTTPGERFWARRGGLRVVEHIVTDEQVIVDLDSGTQWDRNLFERSHTVVPAPEPETVPVPADLIREAVEWRTDLSDAPGRSSWTILKDIVWAVREREEES